MSTHELNTPIKIQQSWATYVSMCWKIRPKFYITTQMKKLISMVGFISTQELVAHNQMQVVLRNINIYKNGNKQIINLKASSSKPNTKNKFTSKNRHVGITFVLVTCWMVMGKLTFQGACKVYMYVMLYIYLNYTCLVYLDILRICILYITYLGKIGKLVKYLPIPRVCTYLGYLSR
jgi:hypothetical protein